MINWLQKLMRLGSTIGLFSKKQYDLDKQKLGKGLMILIKKIPKTLVN